jgi:hypothetical protein
MERIAFVDEKLFHRVCPFLVNLEAGISSGDRVDKPETH